jgi:hypothetical protein
MEVLVTSFKILYLQAHTVTLEIQVDSVSKQLVFGPKFEPEFSEYTKLFV